MHKFIRKLTSILLVLAIMGSLSVTVLAAGDSRSGSFSYEGTYNNQGYVATGKAVANSYSATIGSSSTYSMYIKSRYWIEEDGRMVAYEVSSTPTTSYNSLGRTISDLQSVTFWYYMNATQVYTREINN